MGVFIFIWKHLGIFWTLIRIFSNAHALLSTPTQY